MGGVLYVNTLSYSTFTIKRCVFAYCTTILGGALYLESDSPYILIISSRFEDNSDTQNGDDIFVNALPCLLGAPGGDNSLDNTCSTTQGGNRVWCGTPTMNMLNDCPTTEIV
jgi:hypothetical protein